MNTPSTSTHPLDAMVWVETMALLQRAVRGLCLHRDYTCGEIARLLDRPSATMADFLAAGVPGSVRASGAAEVASDGRV